MVKKFSAYRRFDYVFPRSMREAYGDDDMDPELRCCSELFGKRKRPNWALLYVAIFSLILWQLTVYYR